MKTRLENLFLLPALMAGFGLIPAGRVAAQTFSNLHSFTATHINRAGAYTNSDGAYPGADLILSGNTLYGTASGGGTNGNGTVFAVNTDGTGFTVLHTFTATVTNSSHVYTNSDGANPAAGLLPSGQFVYGTAPGGGMNGNGTVFAVSTDGLRFTNLHSFTALSAAGTNSDGAHPVAGLILGGLLTLYGTAQSGGRGGNGTVFALDIDGTEFRTLHDFAAYSHFINSDGAGPAGRLILSGNTLYGTAADGGTNQNGTVFALNIYGTNFTTLYTFSAGVFGNGDGANPFAGLILAGNTLYGTTHSGGTNDGGTVFAVNINGTGFTNLHNFTGGSDGDNPYAGLMSSGNTLFGTAANGVGALFAVTTNGMDFTTLHTFTNNPDGNSPRASLILSGNTLYGTAEGGGTNGSGTVFSLSLPGPPELTITRSGPTVILTWPTNATGFVLQTTTNLDSPIIWTNAVPAPVAGNLNYAVTNSISDTARFYRLSQ